MSFNAKGAVHYHYGKFPPRNIRYNEFIGEYTSAVEKIARYDQMLKNLHNSEILLAPLRNQEAVLSSRMERTISTMDEILRHEADYAEPNQLHARNDVIETLLYQRTLKNAQNAIMEGYPFSMSMIRQMHQQLLYLGRGSNKKTGDFKVEQNYLGDKGKKNIEFVPIRPENLIDGLERLFQFIECSEFPPLITTAIAHLEFEALDPFQDGNGRIGRMLITLLLWKNGVISQPHFYISGYFEENKREYIESMRNVSKYGDWNNWIKFFLSAVKSQADQNLSVAEDIKELYEKTKIEFESLLSSKWNMTILDYLFTNPIFRNNKLVSVTGIPNTTIMSINKKLLDSGYLEIIEEASGRKAAMYSFEPLMNLVRV